MYPIEKYRYFETKTKDGKKKVIAISTYAGRTVRGVAICDTGDKFDLEKGKKLAAARCAVKVAEKRLARADRKSSEAYYIARDADRHFMKMEEYAADAEDQLDEALNFLEKVLEEI